MHRQRLLFLDQVRGYAIFGMILVNFLGMFDVMPWMFKHHHQGFSYADHIAPLFIFLVGFGYRMSFGKAIAQEGMAIARAHAVRRYFIIIGLGLLYGGFDLRVSIWDALMDIGVSGLLALPFMHLAFQTRITAACVFLAGYQLLFSCTGYGDWVMENSINGGPLG
ncbi:MAG TPA: heparan-alpha-glucosaminide N-acetyltransferase domain-containing protein, partial [Candidatus Hydrogenedentes bacterium]|nr:heparan-alpha-glucosaminide N-acetyltransferase domain-containing protein [Candidatus Hydrogenedentota bacterium]